MELIEGVNGRRVLVREGIASEGLAQVAEVHPQEELTRSRVLTAQPRHGGLQGLQVAVEDRALVEAAVQAPREDFLVATHKGRRGKPRPSKVLGQGKDLPRERLARGQRAVLGGQGAALERCQRGVSLGRGRVGVVEDDTSLCQAVNVEDQLGTLLAHTSRLARIAVGRHMIGAQSLDSEEQ